MGPSCGWPWANRGEELVTAGRGRFRSDGKKGGELGADACLSFVNPVLPAALLPRFKEADLVVLNHSSSRNLRGRWLTLGDVTFHLDISLFYLSLF